LGQILFILFINDLDSVCYGNVKLQLFADDAKNYSSINIDSISVSLQNSLDNLCNWANNWQMTINIGTYAVLSVCNKPVFRVQTYYINGFAVTHNNSYKDLGITVCRNLSFIDHINNVVSKARQRVCMIFRGFISRDCEILRRAFHHVQRVSAKHGVKDDFAFLWEHAIFRHPPNKNPLTDGSEILHN
jgi:hypothetical protein